MDVFLKSTALYNELVSIHNVNCTVILEISSFTVVWLIAASMWFDFYFMIP